MTAMNLNRAIRGPVTAVPVVAGKGVRIVPDVENNRFVVEADETVLFDSGATLNPTLSEAPTNFERIRIVYGSANNSTAGNNIGISVLEIPVAFFNTYSNGSLFLTYSFSGDVSAKQPQVVSAYYTGVKTTSWTCLWGLYGRLYSGTKTESTDWIRIHQIVGINRIANN